MSELEFDVNEWSALTMSQRARRCLLFAEQAKVLAAGAAPPDVKQAYLELSQHWSDLAREIEISHPDRGVSVSPD